MKWKKETLQRSAVWVIKLTRRELLNVGHLLFRAHAALDFWKLYGLEIKTLVAFVNIRQNFTSSQSTGARSRD